MRYIKNVVLDKAFFENINKLLDIDMSALSKLSVEEKKLNPKKNESIPITSIEFDNGYTINLNLYNDSSNYNVDYMVSCTLTNSDGVELKWFDDFTTLEKEFELNYLDDTYKINFWLCNTDVLRMAALEVKEVLDFFENNKNKSFEFFCEHFDADMEDLNSEEDIENGEEPWWEAIVSYKHLNFTMHEDEIIPDIFEIEDGDNYESLDSTETYGGPMGNDKNPKYYKLWLPEEKKEAEVIDNKPNNCGNVRTLPMFLVVRTYNFDPDTCVRKFSSEEAALDFIKTDYENELKDELENEHNHDLCKDKSFFDAEEGRAELITVFYAADGNTYYDSIVWQLVTSVIDCS